MNTEEKKFWSRVDKSGDCWEWTGGHFPLGYGMNRPLIRPDGSKTSRSAHRIAYELIVGPIPAELEIDHLCRNPGCVNPAHLEPVTHRENVLRGNGLAARQARQTHCKYGHPLTDPGDYYLLGPKRTKRHCKTCARAFSVEQNAARREGRPCRPVRELFA